MPDALTLPPQQALVAGLFWPARRVGPVVCKAAQRMVATLCKYYRGASRATGTA